MTHFLHLLHERFPIGDDIGISHDLQELHFHECLLNLLLVHLGDIDYFHYVLLLALLRFDQDRVAETALAHDLHLPVLLHSN